MNERLDQDSRLTEDIRPPDQCPNPACGAWDITTLLQCAKTYRIGHIEGVARFRFARCRACELAYVDPQPHAEVLGAFYPSDYAYWAMPGGTAWLGTRIKNSLAAWRCSRFVKRGLLAFTKSAVARIAEIAARKDASYSLGIPTGMPRSSKILDYGFGGGGFLMILRASGRENLYGYDVEQNRHTRDKLRAAGVQAFCGDEFRRLPDDFDCIRLEHVLEHLPDPIETLTTLRNKLKPGGFLVLTVPSIHAWEPLDQLAGSPHLDHLQLPIHLWHHSRRSIRDFVTAARLEATDVRYLKPHGYLTALCTRPA